MRFYGPLLYPSRIIGPLRSASLTTNFLKVYDWRTNFAMGRRIPLRFEVPIQILIRVSSRIGARRGWNRAGYLAQIIDLLPGDPKGQISRLYFDDKFLSLNGNGNPFWLEFWAHSWLTDYRIELWAKLDPLPSVQCRSLFTLDGEPLTVNGAELII